MRRRVWLAALPIACGELELDPVRIDVSSNCAEVEVVPLLVGIDGPTRPWDRVLAMAVDAPGLASGWMLVLRHDAGGLPELAALYLDGSGVVTVERRLDEPPGAAGTFELQSSGTPGLAWLSQREVGSFTLWRLDAAATNPVQRSQNLAPNPLGCDLDHDPDNAPQSCDAWMWEHRLLFVGRQPVLFTMPPASVDVQIDLWVYPVQWSAEAETPTLGGEVVFHFQPACEGEIEDIELCSALWNGLSFSRIELLGVQRDARMDTSTVALYRELDEGGVVAPELAVVELFTGDSGLAAELTTQPGIPRPRIGGSGLAQDRFASYIRYTATESESVLLQLPYAATGDERFVPLHEDGLPIRADHELLQLDDDIALGRVVGGDWEILKVFPDAPASSRTTIHSVPGEILAVDAAGPSSFLVRRADESSDLVHLDCETDEVEVTDVADAP